MQAYKTIDDQNAQPCRQYITKNDVFPAVSHWFDDLYNVYSVGVIDY